MKHIVNDPNYINFFFHSIAISYRTITKPIIFLNNSFQFQSILHIITKKNYIMKTATKLTKFILQFFFLSCYVRLHPHHVHNKRGVVYRILYCNFFFFYFHFVNSIFHTPKRYHYSLYFYTLFNEPYMGKYIIIINIWEIELGG